MSAQISAAGLDNTGNHGQASLRTAARISLDRTGVSITTRHALEFSLAHAQARDAVHSRLGVASLVAELRARELVAIAVRSGARDRTEYLRRPDLGRTLSGASRTALAACAGEGRALNPVPPMAGPSMAGPSMAGPTMADPTMAGTATVSVVFADGLSALATERHALPLLDALLPLLGVAGTGAASAPALWVLTPVVVAEQARVALADEIGAALHASVTVMLIGERPGLSSPDSLGAYITWAPRPGRTDAERNCVSNIRAEGLNYAAAADKIAWYASQGRRLGLTGVALRESDTTKLPMP